MTLVFSLLGPVHITLDGRPLELGGPRGRRVLAALALEAGRVVPAAGLAAAVWDDPPATAREQVQNAAGALRRLGVPVARTETGFVLEPGQSLLDVREFARLRTTAEAVDDPGEARRLLGLALELWRGPVALGGLRGRIFEAAALRLAEERLDCVERALAADLALGRHAESCAELAALTAEHPLRERLAELRMLAPYRSGRRAEALAVFARARRRLAEETGLDPRRELVALHAAILADTVAPRGPVGPGGAGGSTPAQLPAVPAAFIGRETEAERLREGLRDGGGAVCVVTGAAGIGKTALDRRLEKDRLRLRIEEVDALLQADGTTTPQLAQRAERGELTWQEAHQLAEQHHSRRQDAIRRTQQALEQIATHWAELEELAIRLNTPYAQEVLGSLTPTARTIATRLSIKGMTA